MALAVRNSEFWSNSRYPIVLCPECVPILLDGAADLEGAVANSELDSSGKIYMSEWLQDGSFIPKPVTTMTQEELDSIEWANQKY